MCVSTSEGEQLTLIHGALGGGHKRGLTPVVENNCPQLSTALVPPNKPGKQEPEGQYCFQVTWLHSEETWMIFIATHNI